RRSNSRIFREVSFERDTYREELLVQNEQLREVQRQLEVSRDRYLDLYDFAPFPYVTLDPNGLILNLNLRAAELLGRPRERLVSTPLVIHVVKADRRQFLEHLRRSRAGPEDAKVELRLVAAPPRK